MSLANNMMSLARFWEIGRNDIQTYVREKAAYGS